MDRWFACNTVLLVHLFDQISSWMFKTQLFSMRDGCPAGIATLKYYYGSHADLNVFSHYST